MANKPDPISEMLLSIVPIMTDVISGEIWNKEEGEIKTAQENLAAILTGLKSVAKTFDEQLVNIRKSNPDSLKTIEHFRKPRESKEKSVSLESLFNK